MDRRTEVELVRESIINCHNCDLRTSTPVPMSVPLRGAKVAVIGSGPGRAELRRGKPWVGPVGIFTKDLLSLAGIDLSSVAWLNAVCCGSEPKMRHIEACRMHLRRQLNAINAEHTLVFGQVATNSLLGTAIPMKRLHGHWWKLPNRRWAMATYHPASTKHAPHQEALLKADIDKFAQSVLLQDLAPPHLTEHCITCNTLATYFVQGIPFCRRHIPSVKQPREPAPQLSLFEGIE